MTTVALICNAAVAVALLIAYVVLTVTGHDGTVVLGLLAGQGIGVATAKGTDAAQAGK